MPLVHSSLAFATRCVVLLPFSIQHRGESLGAGMYTACLAVATSRVLMLPFYREVRVLAVLIIHSSLPFATKVGRLCCCFLSVYSREVRVLALVHSMSCGCHQQGVVASFLSTGESLGVGAQVGLAIATNGAVLDHFSAQHRGESLGAGTQYILWLRPVRCCCSLSMHRAWM